MENVPRILSVNHIIGKRIEWLVHRDRVDTLTNTQQNQNSAALSISILLRKRM